MGFVIFYGCFVGLSACRVCRNFFYRMRCLPSLFPYKVCFLSSGVLRKGFVAVMSPIFTIVLIQFFHRNLFLLRERDIFFYNRVYLKIPSELVLTIVVSSLPVVSIQKKCRCVLKSVILQWNKNVYHFFYAAWGPRKQQYSGGLHPKYVIFGTLMIKEELYAAWAPRIQQYSGGLHPKYVVSGALILKEEFVCEVLLVQQME